MTKLMYSAEEVNQILFEITLDKAKVEEKLQNDVIERFKIDNAIKDIAKLSEKTKTIDEYELIGKCITIIKRNIGE